MVPQRRGRRGRPDRTPEPPEQQRREAGGQGGAVEKTGTVASGRSRRRAARPPSRCAHLSSSTHPPIEPASRPPPSHVPRPARTPEQALGRTALLRVAVFAGV